MELNMKKAFVDGGIYKVKGALSDTQLPFQLKYEDSLNTDHCYPEIISFKIIDGTHENYNGIGGKLVVDTRRATLVYEKDDRLLINAKTIEEMFYATNRFVAMDITYSHREMLKTDFIVDIGLVTKEEIENKTVRIYDSYVGFITSRNKDDLSFDVEFQVMNMSNLSIEIRKITLPLSIIISSRYLSLKKATNHGRDLNDVR
jgi:hypothetical protein